MMIPQGSPYHDTDAPDTRPGSYYVSVIDADRFALALGPYDRHADALANVERVSRYVHEHDSKAVWYGFGTCRIGDTFPCEQRGKLNERMGMTATA